MESYFPNLRTVAGFTKMPGGLFCIFSKIYFPILKIKGISFLVRRKLGNDTLQRNRLRFSFKLNSEAITAFSTHKMNFWGYPCKLKKKNIISRTFDVCSFDRALLFCVMLLFTEKRRKNYNCPDGKVFGRSDILKNFFFFHRIFL